jgi:hypothetical protein
MQQAQDIASTLNNYSTAMQVTRFDQNNNQIQFGAECETAATSNAVQIEHFLKNPISATFGLKIFFQHHVAEDAGHNKGR